jgi:hypothetical protein
MLTIPVPEQLVKEDNLLDLTHFDLAVEKLFYEMDAEGKNARYDLRRKIDRYTIPISNPMFALHAIGKVTKAITTEGNPGFESSVKKEENRAWGTGFKNSGVASCNHTLSGSFISAHLLLPPQASQRMTTDFLHHVPSASAANHFHATRHLVFHPASRYHPAALTSFTVDS